MCESNRTTYTRRDEVRIIGHQPSSRPMFADRSPCGREDHHDGGTGGWGRTGRTPPAAWPCGARTSTIKGGSRGGPPDADRAPLAGPRPGGWAGRPCTSDPAGSRDAHLPEGDGRTDRGSGPSRSAAFGRQHPSRRCPSGRRKGGGEPHIRPDCTSSAIPIVHRASPDRQ